MDIDARLEALEAENQRLRDENDMLREKLGATFEAPLELRLTGKETIMLGRLMKGGTVSKDGFMQALYEPGVDDEPEPKIVDVFICKLRAKLKPYGVVIQTIWGRGYTMAPDMVARVAARAWRAEVAA